MKPARFKYAAPASLDEALDLLAQHGYDAKALAGGQSLMPMMNMRLLRPAVVVDINRLPGLGAIDETDGGGLTIGALTRQRALERSQAVQTAAPLIGYAAPHIGHFQVRNRGTIGGSMVHADPSAELPALAVALGAKMVLRSKSGERMVEAEDFFVTNLTAAIEPGELLTHVVFPPPAQHPRENWGWGFQEVCRRDGDFALAGCIAQVWTDSAGVCQSARLTLFGVGETPVRAASAEASLVGRAIDGGALSEAARLVEENLDPNSDIHASAQYRKEVGGVVARRSLAQARDRALAAV